MLNFRKGLLAAAVAGLGLVGVASAQTVPSCSVSAAAGSVNQTGYVAVEGSTELLPAMTIACNIGTTGPINFTITSSAPIANGLKASSLTQLDLQVTDSPGSTVPPAAPVTDAVTSVTASGANAVVITFTTATANAAQTFTIAGIRVNPSSLPVASTVTLTVSSTAATITTATYNAAFVAKSLTSTTVNVAQGAPNTVPNPLNTSLCYDSGTATVPNNTAFGVANITINGNFGDALKNQTDYNGGGQAMYGGGTSVTAKTGTVLAVTLNNLAPAGINYYVPAVVNGINLQLTAYSAAPSVLPGTAATAATGTAATNANTYLAAAAAPLGAPPTPAGPYNAAAAYTSAGGVILLSPNATGSATIYYAVTTAANTTLSQNAVIGVVAVVPVISAVTSLPNGPINISVSLVGVAAPSYPGVSATAAAYTGTPSAANATNGLITACATTIVFPFVSNQDTFDTGLVISNASTGITGVTPASGACNVTFYGNGGTGTATAPFVYNTGAITTGQFAQLAVSDKNAGFKGYAVASCSFLGAHGYAFIYTQGFGGLAANYIAPILGSGTTAYAVNAVGNAAF